MKKFKNSIAIFLYKLILIVAKSSPSKATNKTLLLIKNDEIGDYILFRNFLNDIQKSEKYAGYKITLLGNIIWKQLFDEFDRETVDEVVWMEKKRFQKDLHYRLGLLKTIRQKGFSEVVNCIYSRSILSDECFVAVSGAANIIGMENKTDNSRSRERTNRFYNELIDVGTGIQFDIYRNENFISLLLNKPTNELHTSVFFELNGKNKAHQEPKYCVIFTGAGKQDKLWPPANFAEVINYIHDKYDLAIYLCGGPGDVKDSEGVKRLISVPVQDHTGKTTMPQSLEILKNAEFMLSVDTGSVHMGAGVGCPVIALYSGRDYGRFAPYPKNIFDKFYSVFSDNVDRIVEDHYEELNDPDKFPFSEIKSIPARKVIPYIDLVLSQNT